MRQAGCVFVGQRDLRALPRKTSAMPPRASTSAASVLAILLSCLAFSAAVPENPTHISARRMQANTGMGASCKLVETQYDSNGDPIEVISHLPEGAGWGDCPEDGVLTDRMTCKPACGDGLVLRDEFRCDDGYLAKRCARPADRALAPCTRATCWLLSRQAKPFCTTPQAEPNPRAFHAQLSTPLGQGRGSPPLVFWQGHLPHPHRRGLDRMVSLRHVRARDGLLRGRHVRAVRLLRPVRRRSHGTVRHQFQPRSFTRPLPPAHLPVPYRLTPTCSMPTS